MPAFFARGVVRKQNRLYICNVFFMVLDLRLMKVACREVSNFFMSVPIPSNGTTNQITNRFITTSHTPTRSQTE